MKSVNEFISEHLYSKEDSRIVACRILIYKLEFAIDQAKRGLLNVPFDMECLQHNLAGFRERLNEMLNATNN